MARKMANRCIPDSPRYVPTPVVAATFDQRMEVVRRQCEIEPGETNCLAGHVRFELRNVVANYPFESSRGFPGSELNSGHGDHSRLSCSAGDKQLGAGFCRDLQQRSAPTLAIMRRRREGTNWPRFLSFRR